MLVIDQLVDNRLMQWWRKTVAGKQVVYVCIENELNRDANWPPISQGGKSLVDMMRLETIANSDDEHLLPNSKASDSDREPATDSTESMSPEHISSCTPHPVIDCLSVKIMADNRANCDRSSVLWRMLSAWLTAAFLCLSFCGVMVGVRRRQTESLFMFFARQFAPIYSLLLVLC